jgi:hypothetical protein
MTLISDEELDRLARAADPDVVLGGDAVSIWDVTADGERTQLLPEWYMPAPMPGRPVVRGWRRRVILSLVVTFVVINAYGLCSTYGVVRFG